MGRRAKWAAASEVELVKPSFGDTKDHSSRMQAAQSQTAGPAASLRVGAALHPRQVVAGSQRDSQRFRMIGVT